jgi:hypothetical protein
MINLLFVVNGLNVLSGLLVPSRQKRDDQAKRIREIKNIFKTPPDDYQMQLCGFHEKRNMFGLPAIMLLVITADTIQCDAGLMAPNK